MCFSKKRQIALQNEWQGQNSIIEQRNMCRVVIKLSLLSMLIQLHIFKSSVIMPIKHIVTDMASEHKTAAA